MLVEVKKGKYVVGRMDENLAKQLQYDYVSVAKPDAAMLDVKGGIDLNKINIKVDGRKVQVQFDPAQLKELLQGGFEGFVPVIINMTPIQSPLPLLGVNPRKEESLAKI